jgi:hypothetical protein
MDYTLQILHINDALQSHFTSSQADQLSVAVSYREIRILVTHCHCHFQFQFFLNLRLTALVIYIYIYIYIYEARTTQKSQLYCCIRKTTAKTSHESRVHWRTDCFLETSYKHSFTEIQLLLLRNVSCL